MALYLGVLWLQVRRFAQFDSNFAAKKVRRRKWWPGQHSTIVRVAAEPFNTGCCDCRLASWGD